MVVVVLEVGGGELQLPAGFVQSTAGMQLSEDQILNEEAIRNERQQLALRPPLPQTRSGSFRHGGRPRQMMWG